MQHMYHPEEATRVAEARLSFSARLLTDRQFEDFMAMTGVIERRIQETGSFVEPLNDFSNAIARTERFNAAKADTIIRDLFKARTGVSMNEMREDLIGREQEIFNRPAEEERRMAYQCAIEAGRTVETGDKIAFHRALNHEAVQLANKLDITHVGAKKLAAESFEAAENRTLNEWGKELDEAYYRPQIEALKARKSEGQTSQQHSQQPSYS